MLKFNYMQVIRGESPRTNNFKTLSYLVRQNSVGGND